MNKLKIRPNLVIRNAKITEAHDIKKLIDLYVTEDKILPRSLDSIYSHLREFTIAEADNKIVGCGALTFYSETFAEIRSLAIAREYQGLGIGKEIVEACMHEAESYSIKKVFILTRTPAFFKKLSFSEIDRATLDHKIWRDCLNCPHFNKCDEIAMERLVV